MIGKPEWFTRRKYLGWGVYPKTWQGWVYIAIFILPFAIFQALPFWNVQTRMIVTGVWLLLLIVDVIDIMVRMKLDEREKRHEAISERNALWAILLVLAVGLLYQVVTSALDNSIVFDPVIAAALVGGLIVKAASNIYLDRKD